MNHTKSKRADFCQLTIEEMEKALEFARKHAQWGPFRIEWSQREVLTDKKRREIPEELQDDMPTGLYIWGKNGAGQKLD